MTLIRLALFLALIPACKPARTGEPPTTAVASAGSGLKLPVPTYQVGDRRAKTDDITTTMLVEVEPGKTVAINTIERSVVNRDVLAVDDKGVITKARFTYVTASQSRTMRADREDEPSPLAGKAYIVWRDGDQIRATLADGGAPSTEELDELLEDHENLGTPDPMDALIASKTWKVGEKVTLTADVLAAINTRSPAGKNQETLTAATLTLTAVDDGVATFDIDLTMRNANLTMHLVGIARASVATGDLLEMSGSGPAQMGVRLPIRGSITMKSTASY